MKVNGFKLIKLKELRHILTEIFIQANLYQIKDTVKENIQQNLMDLSLKVISHLETKYRGNLLSLMAHTKKVDSNMTRLGRKKKE